MEKDCIYYWNRHDKPVFITVQKLLLAEFSFHPGLESCVIQLHSAFLPRLGHIIIMLS